MPAVIEDPTIDIQQDEREEIAEAPPTFGRCPVCNKPLRPRCKVTGAPMAPPPGTGFESRARCGGCGYILCYMGNYQWRVLLDSDLTDDDRFADKMGF